MILPIIADAAKKGVLQWFDGGLYKTSTAHVLNVVHGIDLAVQKGKGGKSYFLTDGEPMVWKDYVSRMLQAVDVTPPTHSLPSSIVWVVANIAETVCSIVGCQPLVDRQQLVLTSQEMTVDDSLARSELGYSNVISVEEGMRRLKEINDQKFFLDDSVKEL